MTPTDIPIKRALNRIWMRDLLSWMKVVNQEKKESASGYYPPHAFNANVFADCHSQGAKNDDKKKMWWEENYKIKMNKDIYLFLLNFILQCNVIKRCQWQYCGKGKENIESWPPRATECFFPPWVLADFLSCDKQPRFIQNCYFIQKRRCSDKISNIFFFFW